MKMTTRGLCVVVLAVTVWTLGCETQAQTGAATGAAVGAGAGQAIGRDTEGTLIGAGVGAIAGYIWGNEQDKARAAQERAYTAEMAGTYIVNIHNSNGSITQVPLRREGNLWIGPRGEQYLSPPTEAQLKPVYGF